MLAVEIELAIVSVCISGRENKNNEETLNNG